MNNMGLLKLILSIVSSLVLFFALNLFMKKVTLLTNLKFFMIANRQQEFVPIPPETITKQCTLRAFARNLWGKIKHKGHFTHTKSDAGHFLNEMVDIAAKKATFEDGRIWIGNFANDIDYGIDRVDNSTFTKLSRHLSAANAAILEYG